MTPEVFLFKLQEAAYCGHFVTPDGLKVVPAKVAAIRTMLCPEKIADLRRFFWLVNYLSCFYHTNLTPINR